MKYIYVSDKTYDYPTCPLRTDVNSCAAKDNSRINDCPSLSDEGIWSLPKWCPLYEGVCVKMKPQE